jgi:general secretion pathway protein G
MRYNQLSRSIRSGKASHPCARKGFTLVELLVVIVIIAVLATLSFFGFSKMKSKAKGSTCASNLRQIGTAMVSYAMDNNGELPPLEDKRKPTQNGIWATFVANGGYLAKVINKNNKLSSGAGVWACPECTVVHESYNGYGVAETSVIKTWSPSPATTRSLRLSEVNRPVSTWLVGDALKTTADLKSGWYAVRAKPSNWGSGNSPGPRHNGKVNVCMVDGHVEVMTINEIRDKKITENY